MSYKNVPGPPAFTEANRRKVDPTACACRITDGEIVHCPMHEAAPELLEALENLVTAHDVSMGKGAVRLRIEIAHDLVAKAKGELP